MGNIYGRTQEEKLDSKTKEHLINYINSIRPKNINLVNQIDSIELDNTKLLPMAIELYQKLYEVLGEYIQPDTKSESMTKKKFFIKPTFGDKEISESILSQCPTEATELDTNLIQIDSPIISMITGEITLDEYNDSFGKISSKKDMMGLNKYILRDMSNYLKMRFINSFNKILLDLTTINDICIARGSYIYKVVKHGPLNDINSFRQILSLPHIVNQFHRILNIRLSNYMLKNSYIDTNIQKGGISGQSNSIFEQFFKLKNVLKDANTHKKKSTILFLDISNAFGSLKLEKLFEVLKLYGVDDEFIAYVKNFYASLEYYIGSNTYKWTDGLIQGCSLSSLLFIIALNYILVHLDQTYKDDMGFEFENGTKILLTAYMDDICIICKDSESAQFMYEKFVYFAKMLGLEVNKSKCAVMVLNDDMEFDEIKRVDMFKYLGEYLSIDGTSSQSYIIFMKILRVRLYALNNKFLDNLTKAQMFKEEFIPWIQRKTLLMYDMTNIHRLKLVSTIKPYIEKWGITQCEIFADVAHILNNSTDSIIKEITDIEVTDTLIHDIEIANYVCNASNIRFEYNQIDENYIAELELENFLEYSNQ